MKKIISFMLTFVLVLSLAACSILGGEEGKKKETEQVQTSSGETETNQQSGKVEEQDGSEAQVVRGIINKIDSYLVLLVGEGEYQIMDLGEGVTLDQFSEGDEVDVTYTGELGLDDSSPVATAIVKVQ